MRTLDFSPLYRSAIGFDRLVSMVENAAAGSNNNTGYPPYNIELLDENHYRITMAVAGFSQSELDITSQENTLTVKGVKEKNAEQASRRYLYQGIAERGFERKFQLADYVKVIGADMENGLLHIDLEREIPEAKKPRKIAIGNNQQQLDVEKAS